MSHHDELRSLITIDPDLRGGEPVFKGTRVPLRTLLEYLQNNYSLDEFLDYFPSVTREIAEKFLTDTKANEKPGVKARDLLKVFSNLPPLTEGNATSFSADLEAIRDLANDAPSRDPWELQ